MAHESFEDEEIAEILNQYFVSIKVDKEIRPDVDNIYMSVCVAMTGSGGWPLSVFMTPRQKPFFAGTYYPKTSRGGQIGFKELLITIGKKWQQDRNSLLSSADVISEYARPTKSKNKTREEDNLSEIALIHFLQTFDERYGGFGNAPKFPSPHNLLFLLDYYELFQDVDALKVVERTLQQMYKGGIFDHLGGGFARYSTDKYFLVPHFEKMLYDNAMLIMAYARAYGITKKIGYLLAAERTAQYIMQEMTDQDGAFYSAQDADSEAEEGKYYVFSYDEILRVLGEEAGIKWNQFYGVSPDGNFEGKNIMNLLKVSGWEEVNLIYPSVEDAGKLYEYRKSRTFLLLDDKILTAWNAMMITAFSVIYQVTGKQGYLDTAKKAAEYIKTNLSEGDILYVGSRNGKRIHKGFLDDYAYYILAMLRLYDASLESEYLKDAQFFCSKAIDAFEDKDNGGFSLSGNESEKLIFSPKETYDGALPSSNSVMTYNLLRLSQLCPSAAMKKEAEKQLAFMTSMASEHPAGHGFFLVAYLYEKYPPEHIVCVLKDAVDLERLKRESDFHRDIIILEEPTDEYPLLNDRTTYYICRKNTCLPPVNEYQ